MERLGEFIGSVAVDSLLVLTLADFQCHLVWLTLDKRCSLAPVKNFRRVLDVGCGTGWWTIEFGMYLEFGFTLFLVPLLLPPFFLASPHLLMFR